MSFDVFGMCYALFDLQASVPQGFPEELGLTPGAMHLMNAEQQNALVLRIRDRIVNQAAGGSGANTTIGVAALGGAACFTSRVGADDFGPAYAASLRDAGVQPNLPVGPGATGACVVLVTPDAQRTMCTHLGEGRHLTRSDVNLDDLRASKLLYVTGYLWDTESQKDAVQVAIHEAHRAGVPVSFSLADTFCITRNRDDFLRLLHDDIKIVFGNEDEAMLLSEADDPRTAASWLSSDGRTAFVTLGARGALVAENGRVSRIEPSTTTAIDTTGAGDAFAAGAIYGLTHGMPPVDSAHVGSRLAAHVVSRMGPRPAPDELVQTL